MKFSAEQIAEVLEGVVIGNTNVEVSKLTKIEEGEEGALTFLSNPKYTHYAYNTKASIIIVDEKSMPKKEVSTTLVKVSNSYEAFAKLLEMYNEYKGVKVGIEKHSFISKNASYGKDLYLGSFAYIGENVKIGNNVKIYPNTYIGDNVKIYDNTVIYAGVKIYDSSVIGKNCVIHSGTVVGADGFGFAPNTDNVYNKVPQIGNVIIEDNVEVGSCCTIDRATLGSTVIKKGVKLDNQIQVAHNVEIGQNTVVAAQSGISGSTKIGKNCMIGGQVGIVGHLKIGDGVMIAAQSGVTKNLGDKSIVQGSPAISNSNFNKSFIWFKNIKQLVERIINLENKIDKIN